MQRRVSRCDMKQFVHKICNPLTGPKLKQLANPCRGIPVSAKSRRGRVPAEPRQVSPLRLTATTRVRLAAPVSPELCRELAAPVCPELGRELAPSSAVSSLWSMSRG
jgi:hypothetical protein